MTIQTLTAIIAWPHYSTNVKYDTNLEVCYLDFSLERKRAVVRQIEAAVHSVRAAGLSRGDHAHRGHRPPLYVRWVHVEPKPEMNKLNI